MNKLFQIILVAIAAGFSACSSTSEVSSGRSYDDVYATSSGSSNSQPQSQQTVQENYSNQQAQQIPSDEGNARFGYDNTAPSESTTDGNGNTYITNNYYNNDDYYDYAYSSRIRRFYHPVGWGYYDSYYTNCYMYDSYPSSWGMSIYMGYNWWAPPAYYYSPFSWGISFNYGYPAYGYYSPCHSNYYAYSPCGSCGGCGNMYYQGCGNYSGGCAYNPYYYNSYDYNCGSNYYYGPRRSGVSNTSNTHNPPRSSVAQLYEQKYLDSSPTKVTAINSAYTANNSTMPIRTNSNTIKNSVRSGSEGAPIKNNTIKNDVRSGSEGAAPVKNNTSVPIRSNNVKDVKDNDSEYSDPKNNNSESVTPTKGNTVKPKNNTTRPKSNYQPSTPPTRNNNSTPKNNSTTPRPRTENAPKNNGHSYQSVPKSMNDLSVRNNFDTRKQNTSRNNSALSYAQPQQNTSRNNSAASSSRQSASPRNSFGSTRR